MDLARRTDIRFIHANSTTLPQALRVGRDAVDTPFFSELDDDDELLPGALSARLEALRADENVAAVISNAVLRSSHGKRESVPDREAVESDPLRALLTINWMVPGSALFRTDVVTSDYFSRMPPYLEWTYLGLRLALAHRLSFLSEPSAVHWNGLPFSINDSSECRNQRPNAVDRLLELPLPADVRRTLKMKQAAYYHEIADASVTAGARGSAWRAHLKSLFSPSGAKYLPFTRHLIGPHRSRGKFDS